MYVAILTVVFLEIALYFVYVTFTNNNYLDIYEPRIIRLSHCRYTGTEWGNQKHNEILDLWKSIIEDYQSYNIQFSNEGLLCCPSGLSDQDFKKYFRIEYICGNKIIKTYNGNYDQESIRNFIDDILIK
jgi:hypothetical protein